MAFGEAEDGFGAAVGLAVVFEGDAGDGVEEEEEAGEDAVGEFGVFDAEGEEDDGDEEAFAEGFIKLGGVAGVEEVFELGAAAGVVFEPADDVGAVLELGGDGDGLAALGEVVFVVEFGGEFDGPGDGGDAAEELAIDEVGEAAEEDAEGGATDEGIAKADPGDFVFASIPEAEEGDAGDAAVAGHATLVDEEEDPGGADEFVEVVEEHVAEAAAEDDAEEGDEGDEVGDLIGLEFGEAALGEEAHDAVGEVEAEDVGEAVPVDGEVAEEFDDVGVEVVEVVGGVGHRRVGEGGGEGRGCKGV